jgi:hypothetical protein
VPKAVDYDQVVSRFLYYAAFCREMADRPSCRPEHRAMLLAQAARWDRDAERVLRDKQMMAEGLALLA